MSVDVTSKCRWPFSSPAFFSFVRLGVGWRWADSIFVHTRTRHVFWTAGGPATFALSLRPLVAVVWGACPNQSASAPHFSARFQRANNSCEKARASGRPSPPQKTPCRRGLFFFRPFPMASWAPGLSSRRVVGVPCTAWMRRRARARPSPRLPLPQHTKNPLGLCSTLLLSSSTPCQPTHPTVNA